MPTYEYKCKSCGARSEHFQSMSARPIRRCDACGKNALERLIGTGSAIVFKGSGFYQTDYRSEAYKQAAKAESGSADPKKDGSTTSKGAASGDGTGQGGTGRDGTGATKAETKAQGQSSGLSDAKAQSAPQTQNTTRQGQAPRDGSQASNNKSDNKSSSKSGSKKKRS